MEREDTKSRYQKLEVPDFHSTIPAHLLGQLTDQGKYLVETLSKIEQQNQWLINAVLECNRVNVETDIRVQQVERWKEMLTSKWAMVSGVMLLAVPPAIEYALTRLLGK